MSLTATFLLFVEIKTVGKKSSLNQMDVNLQKKKKKKKITEKIFMMPSLTINVSRRNRPKSSQRFFLYDYRIIFHCAQCYYSMAVDHF